MLVSVVKVDSLVPDLDVLTLDSCDIEVSVPLEVIHGSSGNVEEPGSDIEPVLLSVPEYDCRDVEAYVPLDVDVGSSAEVLLPAFVVKIVSLVLPDSDMVPLESIDGKLLESLGDSDKVKVSVFTDEEDVSVVIVPESDVL
jgi:hypothetical protein